METKVIHKTNFLELKQVKYAENKHWTYAHRPNISNVVVILPIIKKQNEEFILFLKTKRPPLLAENKSNFNLEIPAGLVGDIIENEDIKDAIKRELEEESGYSAHTIDIVSKNISSTAGLTSETSVLAIAYIDGEIKHKKPTDNDSGVIVDSILVKKEEVRNFIENFESQGNTIGAQTLSALFYYFVR